MIFDGINIMSLRFCCSFLILLFFILLLSSGCSSIDIKKFSPLCKTYDYIEFCNYDAYENEGYIKKLKHSVKVPDFYIESLKLKKQWNNALRKAYEKEKKYKDLSLKYKTTEIAKLIRKKGKTSLKINSFSNYDFTRFVAELRKRENIIELPEYITQKYNLWLPIHMCEDILPNCGKTSSLIPLNKISIIDDLKIKKQLYSDSLYIDESIRDYSDKLMSVYTDGRRKVFITDKSLSPQVDRMGNLLINISNIGDALNEVMLHEAIHIVDRKFSPAVREYAYNIRGSKKFLSANKKLLKYSQISSVDMDLFKGDKSIGLKANKETYIDAKVLGLLENNKNSCLRYLNVLKNNVVHENQKLRINFVKIGCELMGKKSYNIDNLFKMFEEFSSYQYSEESVALLIKNIPNYKMNFDIQLALLDGIIKKMNLIEDDRKIFVSFLISLLTENLSIIFQQEQ